MDPEVIAAFQCAVGPSIGAPHDWDYLNRPNGKYRCKRCLMVMTKVDLKRLTDDA